jgi:UDP-N-acetylmuramate--alanine ligase
MLAQLAKLKRTITVAGCHGKTTTTSMVAMALAKAGADPTMIIGGQLKNISSNARLGLGDYLIAEADESDGSFLLLSPLVAVVTNVDNDHLDYYKTMANIRTAFLDHLRHVPRNGSAVLCADDQELSKLIPKVKGTVITYGINRKADWQAKKLELSAQRSTFDIHYKGRRMGRGELRVPGQHNVLNALAAIAAGRFLGFDLNKLLAGLKEFTGVGRRMDHLGDAAGVTFLDDYGHHPTEIRTTVSAVRQLYCCKSKDYPKGRRLIVIFQPHRFSRTKALQTEFGPALTAADFVYVPEIYPAGERPIAGVTSELVLRSLKQSRVTCAPMPRAFELAKEIRPGDVMLTIGAGDVWKIGEDLRRRLTTQNLAGY